MSTGTSHLFLAAALVAVSLLVAGPQDASVFATQGYPAEMVSAARLTEQRCTKCHTMGRVLEAEYVGDEWNLAVHDMAKKEKSGISAQEAAKIASFLAFRSTRKAGAAGASASRPGHTEGAGSRPSRFGSADAYPLPAHTVYASAPISPSASLPLTLELAGVSVQVREASATSDPSGASRATVRVVAGEREKDVALARDAAGAYSSEVLPLRGWTIGPHAFQLVLAVYETDAAPFTTDRPGMTLALLVVRSRP